MPSPIPKPPKSVAIATETETSTSITKVAGGSEEEKDRVRASVENQASELNGSEEVDLTPNSGMSDETPIPSNSRSDFMSLRRSRRGRKLS